MGRSHVRMVLALLLAACGGQEVRSISFALGAESLPDGTDSVSVVIISWSTLEFGCLGSSANLPGGGVVSSTAELICAVDPACDDLAPDGRVLKPVPVFRAAQIEAGVVIEDVPADPTLVFLEAFDAENRSLGTGCATASVRDGTESVVTIRFTSDL